MLVFQPRIIDYIASESGPGPEIFMGLKDGTLTELVKDGCTRLLAEALSRHILEALTFLAGQDIVHRDVKPDNILYVRLPNQSTHPCFQLGDFGLASHADFAVGRVGTPLYRAPEITFGSHRQTPKVDVWSFFVTMLWTLNVDAFREKSHRDMNDDEILNFVQRASKDAKAGKIALMAEVNPENRPSAAQMLSLCLDL
jgi:serine/threonine protein kinase